MTIDYQRFVCNIYDPRLPDSDSKLVSEKATPEKRDALIRFMRDMIDQFEIGDPCDTHSVTQEQLKEANMVGLYKCDRTKDLGAIALVSNFVAVRPPAPETPEPKKKFQMNFRRRPKQVYKFPQISQDKSEVLTIDDYVPPKPQREDD